mmetsp:Transcript_45727/g.110818  ORF Transcript_45727/g.110818 Transcript_45727/m.110818 type:complete len:90 (-) Transcript_45727:32-301(-)
MTGKKPRNYQLSWPAIFPARSRPSLVERYKVSIRRPSLVAQMDSQFHRSLGRMDLAGSVSVYSSTNGEIVKMDVKSQILNFLGSTVIFT